MLHSVPSIEVCANKYSLVRTMSGASSIHPNLRAGAQDQVSAPMHRLHWSTEIAMGQAQ
ncbi:hypothetical protein BVRB_3g062670 [Beta vulgaris subsp. vulgaris]|nr:hypothetical protein BVRB_3g062670 [Beta vulgaris subsp. vulgaris]